MLASCGPTLMMRPSLVMISTTPAAGKGVHGNSRHVLCQQLVMFMLCV